MTTAPIPSPEKIRDYVLRRLPEEERGRVEEAYFSDDALLERIEDEEDRLVSDYVLGRLDAGDRQRFEEALLGSPYYRRRVETSGSIHVALAARAALPARPAATPPDGARRPAVASDAARHHRVTLLPGQTGRGVAFALLVILLFAAVLAAWTLRRDLVDLRRRGAAPAAPTAARAAPSDASARAAFLLLDDAGLDGPVARRLPEDGGPVVLVVPAYRLPAEATGASFVLLDETGLPAWRSEAISRSEQAGGGVVGQLPAGLPVSGRGALLLLPEGAPKKECFLAALLRDDAAPEQGKPRSRGSPGDPLPRHP